MLNNKYSWTDFKNNIISKDLQILMTETDTMYYLSSPNGPVFIRCDLPKTTPKSSDQIDFENNFKNQVNPKIKLPIDGEILNTISNTLTDKTQITKITGNDGLYQVSVDSVGRLATNANVTYPEVFYQDVSLINSNNSNANVNGSISSPINFRWSPTDGNVWYIENITFLINDNANFSNVGFGGLTALTNGVEINIRTKSIIQNLTVLRNNYDVIKSFKDDVFSSVASGLFSTDRIYRGSIKLQNRIVLDPNLGDYIEMRIRDNVTGLTGLFCNALVWRING